jgi:hypothetical protein
MSENPILDGLYQLIMGGLIMPVVSWIKAKLPTDFPLQTTVVSAVLSVGVVFLINKLFTLNMDWNAIIQYALGTYAAATLAHSMKKTGQETNLAKTPAGTPSVSTPAVVEE